MTRHRVALPAALTALLAWGLTSAAAPAPDRKPPTADDIAKAQKIVEGDEKLKERGAAITPIENTAIGKALPDCVFIAVLFRQFPVGRVPPEGLSSSNVFAVDRDGKVTILKDAKELEKFCREHLGAVKGEDRLKDAARAWVALAQQFHQDGFYKFKLMDDATKATDEDGGHKASATLVAMQGGSGTLSATLTFDDAGKLAKVSEDVKLRPGPRPICQATKLLDPDPIVRKMAEQDLLIMGAAARDYLLEQRAKASPELRKVIDGLWQRIERQP